MDEASKEKRPLPLGHWAFGTFSIICGVSAFIWGGELINGNERATGVIVTVFSILAGFLIAVMTLLGDQSMLPGGWKLGIVYRDRMRAKLTRQKWLFCLYLVTLAVIFASALMKDLYPDRVLILERVYFGLATTAFVLSIRLPWTLMSIQVDRLDAVIAARKAKSSILDRT